MQNVHDGHRARLKQRYREQGLDGFSDLHVLELLLFFCVPRGDVNPLAHRLLERFGSLAGVMDAAEEDLLSVKGVGANCALMLKLVPQMSRRYLISANGDKPVLDTPDKLGGFVMPYYYGAKEERFYLVSLDAKLRLLGVDLLSEGDGMSTPLSVRKLMATALERKAVHAVVTHNHPSGSLTPSEEDIVLTRQIRTALKMMNVDMVDHIIATDENYFSMANGGYFN